MDKEKEYAALIERIKATVLADSPQLCGLLDYLYKHRHKGVRAADIEEDFFGFPPLHDRFDPAHSREEVSRLKGKLRRYSREANNEKWECELPKPVARDGYKLSFEPVKEAKLAPSEILWKPHLTTAEDTIVISGSHLFFFDQKQRKIVRYADFNAERDEDETLKQLKEAHSECDPGSLRPWHNVYLASGDVHAYEALLRWFYARGEVLIKRTTSRDISDKEAHRLTPILIGRPQTNRFIARIMTSRQGSHLRYRIHAATRAVKIERIRPEERQRLAQFPVGRDGVIGPVEDSGTVFGIVSRLRNPSGYGHVTIVASDYYAMVIARIVEVMTDDKHALELLKKMKWPLEKELPESYEMLFAVTLSPGNLEGEGYPELLCWSPAAKED